MASIDMREVTTLAADFGRAGARALTRVEVESARGAANIEKDMKSDAQSNGRTRHFSGAISFERSPARFGSVSYDVGPDKGRTQGALGNLLYFGSVNNGPILDIEAGLRAEEPRFVRALGLIAGEVAGGRG